MGDRYTISIECYKCGQMNHDIYYAESAGSTEFQCEWCKAKNRIELRFVAVEKKKRKYE